MTPKDVAEKIIDVLDGKKAGDLKLLKTDRLTVLADYFVICTANSTSHIKTLSDEVERVLEEAGETVLRREGYREGGWVLLDFGCAIVHLFLEDTRKFYNLEHLWSDAESIDVEAVLNGNRMSQEKWQDLRQS